MPLDTLINANIHKRTNMRGPALTSALLILLLGKYCEYSNDRSGLHSRSSQTFLPRSSSNGREQKSSSMMSELGTVDAFDGELAAVLLLLVLAASAASSNAAASAVHLHLTLQRLLLPAPCRP